jgi:hypothetical protein
MIGCVKASTIEGAGQGLFAKQFLSKGTIVAAMQDPVLLPTQVWQQYEATHPDDYAVYVYHLRKYVWDRNKTAIWKKMNHHKRRRNAKMVLQVTDNNDKVKMINATWIALRDIQQGEELLWDYGAIPT